jgi:hypothetical protein
MLRIGAIIWVERGTKQIVIGKGGGVLKQVGTRAPRTGGCSADVRAPVGQVSRDWWTTNGRYGSLEFDETD